MWIGTQSPIRHGGPALLAALDAKEGHPTRYSRGERPVHTEPLDGGTPLLSWLYRVTPAHETPDMIPPRAAYRQLLIQGAEQHGLGESYVSQLRRVRTSG